MKIRTKIYLSYAGLIIFIFTIFGVIYYTTFKNHLIDQLKEDDLAFARLIESFFLNQSDKIKDFESLRLYFEGLGYKFLQDYVVIVSKDGSIEYSNKDLSIEAKVKIMSLHSELSDGNSELHTISYLAERPFMFTFYRNKNNKRFDVLIISDLERFTSFQKRFFFLMFQSIIFTIIASLFISIFVSRQMIQNLLKLKDGIIEASKLKFNKKVNINSKDEIGIIAKEFNKLIDKIYDYNQSQIRLFQNISHELKTPLTSIRGYAEVLKSGILDEKKAHHAIDSIIDQVDRLKVIINQIINLTRIESQEQYFEFKQVSLNNVIFDAIVNNQGFALSKNIEIVFEPKEDIIIWADFERVVEAFSNIISNCIRYAKSFVKIQTQILSIDRFKVVIEDDGPGVKEDELDKIFERFYKGKRGETGLGLSISKAIFDKHNFEIKAEENYPTGTIFTINGNIYKSSSIKT